MHSKLQCRSHKTYIWKQDIYTNRHHIESQDCILKIQGTVCHHLYTCILPLAVPAASTGTEGCTQCLEEMAVWCSLLSCTIWAPWLLKTSICSKPCLNLWQQLTIMTAHLKHLSCERHHSAASPCQALFCMEQIHTEFDFHFQRLRSACREIFLALHTPINTDEDSWQHL